MGHSLAHRKLNLSSEWRNHPCDTFLELHGIGWCIALRGIGCCSVVLKGTPTLTDDGFALIWNAIMIALSCHYHCSDGTKLLSSCFGESAIESCPADHRTLNRQRPKYLECNKSSTDPGGGFLREKENKHFPALLEPSAALITIPIINPIRS